MRLPDAVVDAVWLRDLSRCFRCARILHRGQGGYSIQHRRPRGMGGSRQPATSGLANLILLCGSGVDGCHGWVEHNRTRALADGLLVLQSQDPARVPVLRWQRHRILLDNEGMWRPAGSPDASAMAW